MQPVNNQQRIIAAIILLVLSLFIVIIAIRGVSRSVNSFTSGEQSDEPLIVDALEITNQKLRNQDTDGDGLNDYDELYLYNSSPYLEDSDSDGINDKEEVDSGGDPNCPGSQDCYGAVIKGSKTFTGDEYNYEAPLILDQELANRLKDLLPSNPSADDIRELLVSQGASQSSVDEASDEELLDNYSRTYNAL